MAGKERAAAARAVENERRDWLPILEAACRCTCNVSRREGVTLRQRSGGGA
jgi:hypothetical protein